MKNTLFLSLAAVLTASFALAEDAPKAADAAKVEITGNDALQYSTKTFEVTAGQSVSLTLKNIGSPSQPKTAMAHNVVILKPGTPVVPFAMKGMPAKDADYIPQDADSKALIIAHTKLVGGGESDTITFNAPTEAGAYPFLCTFPGHFALMQGVMTVKAK